MKFFYTKNIVPFLIVFTGCNIIHFSLRTAEIEQLAQGLEYVASAKKATITGTTNLMKAIIDRNKLQIKQLLSQKTTIDTINQQDSLGNTALHYAAMPLQQICAKNFSGMQMNKCKRHFGKKQSGIHGTKHHHQQHIQQKINLIKELVSKGAKKDIKNNKGQTAFDIANSSPRKKQEILNVLK